MTLAYVADLARKFQKSTISVREATRVRSSTFAEFAMDVAEAKANFRDERIAAGELVAIRSPNCYDWLVWDVAARESGVWLEALPDEGGLPRNSDGELELRAQIEPRPKEPGSLRLRALRTAGIDGTLVDPDVLGHVYSSGTTGRPRRLRISRKGTEHLVSGFQEAYEVTSDDTHLIFLPLSNYQQRVAFYGCLSAGVSVAVTTPAFLFQDLEVFKPTFFIAPPAFYDVLKDRVSRLRSREECRSVLAAMLGGRARLMITGMAPIRRSTHEFLLDFGLPLYEVYGLTEAGMVTWNRPGCSQVGTVGVPVDEGAVSLGEDGEVLVTPPVPLSVPMDEAQGGSIATGDIGHFDGPFLILNGRKKNVLTTSGGLKLHPEMIESELLNSLLIRHCVVTNDNETATITAVVSIVGVTLPEAEKMAADVVDRVNATLPAHVRVRSLIVTDVEFSPGNGLLTRNLKLDRAQIIRRFCPRLAGGI